MNPILESVLPQVNIYQDCNTLGHLLKAWTDLINEADDEKKKELNVAALTALQDLLFDDEGRKAWFEKVKTPAETDWNPHEDAQVQDWNTKLLRIASVVNSSVDTVIERFDQAKSIVQRYNNSLTLKDRYSAPDLMLQVLMGELDVDAITRGVKDALVDAKKWIEDLNRFFNWNPTRDTLREYQVLFTGTGLKEIEINWVQFRKGVDDN